MNKILLCCDLDRTVLPNGNANESPGVHELFAQMVQKLDLTLAYVSGRNLDLLHQAIDEYQIPEPDYAIGDVGSTLYHIVDGVWQPVEAWAKLIGADWQHHTAEQLHPYLENISELTLQEVEKQNIHKLSYYISLDVPEKTIVNRIREILVQHDIHANIIYSIDEIAEVGLIDILPDSASKLHAIEYLISYLATTKENTLFAGDSGNDLAVLCSDVPAVLVNNAHASVKKAARQRADRHGLAQALYLARGGFYGLNGNYSAGIIEGLYHFHPELRPLIAELMSDLGC